MNEPNLNIDDSLWKIVNGTLLEYKGKRGPVIIPEGVTHIADGVFKDKFIGAVKFPNSLTIIGNNAFENAGLTSLELPPHIYSIGEKAFYRNLIKHIDIPNSLMFIGDDAFGPSTVKSLVVSDIIRRLRVGRFKEIFNPKKLTIDFSTDDIIETLKMIWDYEGTVELYEEQIPKYLRPKIANMIKTFDIKYVERKPTITLDSPNVVEHSLETSPKEETFVVIDGVLVKYYPASSNENRIVEIPYGVKEIAPEVFKDLPVSCVKIPDTVKKIGSSAFEKCGLKKVYLPKSIEEIGQRAFYYNFLTSVEIPENIKYLGINCFSLNQISTTIAPAASYGNINFEVMHRLSGEFVVDNSAGKAMDTIEKLKGIIKPSKIIVVGNPLSKEEKSQVRSLFGLLTRISHIEMPTDKLVE